MIDTSDFRTGLSIQIDGEPYTLIYFQHVKPGKGGAFVRTKLKSVRTGNVFERTFRAGEKFEPAYLERKELEFIYRAGDDFFFMDTETFDQTNFSEQQLGESRKYLKEGMKVSVLSHNGAMIGVEIPDSRAGVVETDPACTGDTASAAASRRRWRPAPWCRPLFISVGEMIRRTRGDNYLEREEAVGARPPVSFACRLPAAADCRRGGGCLKSPCPAPGRSAPERHGAGKERRCARRLGDAETTSCLPAPREGAGDT